MRRAEDIIEALIERAAIQEGSDVEVSYLDLCEVLAGVKDLRHRVAELETTMLQLDLFAQPQETQDDAGQDGHHQAPDADEV